MARLPQVLPPRRGESVHGFVRRLAEINGITLSATMKLAGIGRIRPVSDDRLWNNLAEAAGLGVDTLGSMRRLPAGAPGAPGAITFMGHVLRPSHLVHDDMRVCPPCIRHRGTLREVWSISQITCCPQHECLLVGVCDRCGRKLKFHLAGSDYPWACVCDRELADLPVIPASQRTLAAARLFYPVVGRTEVTGYVSLARKDDEGIPPFDGLCLNDLLATMDLIGTVATTPAKDDPPAEHTFLPYGITGPARSSADFVRRTEAAIEIMERWPDSWHEVLDDLAGRSPPGASSLEDRAVLATRMGRRCLAPDRGIDGVPLQLIARETHRWLEERKGIVRRKRHRTSESARARLLARTMNASTVARELGIRKYVADFKRIYDETIDAMEAEGCIQPAKRLGELVLGRVRSRWEDLNATVSSVVASEMIEGFAAEKGLKGWDHPDLILPATDFEELARKRKSSYRLDDVERILGRLRDASAHVENVDHFDHLTTIVMRRTLTTHYDKTDLLHDVLSGRVATWRTVDRPRLCDLYADLKQVNRRAVSCRATALSDQDAMLDPRPLNNMLEVLWGTGSRLGVKESRGLREKGKVRFEQRRLWNATEERWHSNYAYSVRDVLLAVARRAGPSGIPELDRMLRQFQRSKVAGIGEAAA